MKGSQKSMVAYSKQAERDVAKVFGGRRLSAGEWQGDGDVDVIVLDGAAYAIQVKQRTGVPKWFIEGMDQVKDAVKDTKALDRMGISFDLLPIMVVKTKPGQGKPSKMYIVLELEDWENRDYYYEKISGINDSS